MADLECNHCGDVAFTSATDLFTDGDGEKCQSCGMPGHVSVDGDNEDPYENAVSWNDTQESGVYCERPDCEECNEMRVEEGSPMRTSANG